MIARFRKQLLKAWREVKQDMLFQDAFQRMNEVMGERNG